MSARKFRVLHVNASDIGGGAARVAWNLFKNTQALGHDVSFAVGVKRSDDSSVLIVSDTQPYFLWSGFWNILRRRFRAFERTIPRLQRFQRVFRWLANPRSFVDYRLGREDFRYPGSWHVLDLTEKLPDILHLHNLHGGYFDLEALPFLTGRVPTIITAQDAWLLSGHCGHSFSCHRWKSGCGECPDLTIYPAIYRDATENNWAKKRSILSESRVYVATSNKWLMKKFENSLFGESVIESRVIPDGVDTSIFKPIDRVIARANLGISNESKLVLIAGHTIRKNIWRDYQMMRDAMAMLSENLPNIRLAYIALGEKADPDNVSGTEISFVPYQKDQSVVANYYQAADIYFHASKADTFPNSVIEAMACGIPVVATTTGGIVEQVVDGETGILVPQGDHEAAATALGTLLEDDLLRENMGKRGAEIAAESFGLQRQVNAYLDWYQEILNEHGEAGSTERHSLLDFRKNV